MKFKEPAVYYKCFGCGNLFGISGSHDISSTLCKLCNSGKVSPLIGLSLAVDFFLDDDSLLEWCEEKGFLHKIIEVDIGGMLFWVDECPYGIPFSSGEIIPPSDLKF